MHLDKHIKPSFEGPGAGVMAKSDAAWKERVFAALRYRRPEAVAERKRARESVAAARSRLLIPGATEPTAHLIMTFVGIEFGVSVADLKCPSTVESIVLARHVACFLIREITKDSLPKMGAMFNRHHTTIMHAVRRTRRIMETSPAQAARIAAIRARIEAVEL